MTHALVRRHDSSEDGCGRGVPLVPAWPAEVAPTLYALMGDKMGIENQHVDSGCGHFVPAVTGALTRRYGGYAMGAPEVDAHPYVAPVQSPVRRLTPRECERLQGFPDDYTAIPYRGKPAPDVPRYKALGNSMAVPVMRWIGRRIALVDAID